MAEPENPAPETEADEAPKLDPVRAEKIEKMEAWIVQMEGELEALETSWKRLPRVVPFALILPWFALFWSGVAFVGALFVGVSFLFTLAWILGVRRNETRFDLDEARHQLTRLRG